jgi:hypothetical protein
MNFKNHELGKGVNAGVDRDRVGEGLSIVKKNNMTE